MVRRSRRVVRGVGDVRGRPREILILSRSKPREAHRRGDVLRRFGVEPATVLSWVALIVAALIAFWATRATQYRQLGVGILLSSATLLCLLLLFEAVWQLLLAVLGFEQSDRHRR